MTKKKPEKKKTAEISYFIEDANFLTLWLLTDPRLYQQETFEVDDISPLSDFNHRRVFSFLVAQMNY